MKAKFRFVLAACVLGLLMTGPFGLTALLLFADAKDAERAAFAEFLLPRLPQAASAARHADAAGASAR